MSHDRNGREKSARAQVGLRRVPRNPMSWGQVQAKFDRLTDGKLDKALGREISAIASEIDTVPVKQLTALLARVSAR